MSKGTQKIFINLCNQFGLPAPTPEFQFAKDIKRRWRIDYYFDYNGKRIALEVEGGVYTRGRHTRPTGFVKDMEKYNEMAKRGILLLRCQPKDLLKMDTLNLIKETIYRNDTITETKRNSQILF